MRNSTRRWTGIAAGVIALAVASPALGQDAEAPRMHDPEKRIEHLAEELDLTDAQLAEVRAIFAEQAEKRRDLDGQEDREAMRAHVRATHERLASVLTAEQREKLGELREHREEGRCHRDGEG